MWSNIIILLVALVAVTVFAALVSTLVISNTTGSSVATKPAALQSRAVAVWSENLRNNKNYAGFPPCYNTDVSSKTIYGILSRAQLVQRYFNLLDILSVLLCLKQGCSAQDVKDRYVQIVGMGANLNDEDARALVAGFAPLDDTMISKLLVGAVHIIGRQLNVLRNDSVLSVEDRDKINGLIYTFYAAHLEDIYAACKA